MDNTASNKNQNPDPRQDDKSNPDPHQSDADLQHWFHCTVRCFPLRYNSMQIANLKKVLHDVTNCSLILVSYSIA